MKRVLLICGLGLLAASLVTAQLVITSFNNNGDLTWTNSLSGNATYRVEWAGSTTGPWQKFDALTNLTLLSATSNVVTVKVPTVYRVVWLDAPAHAGTWNYSGYHSNGSLIVTGQFTLSVETNPITGSWDFKQAGDPELSRDHPVGTWELRGLVRGSSVELDLYPGWSDTWFALGGDLAGNTYTGTWATGGSIVGGGVRASGAFSAKKKTIDP